MSATDVGGLFGAALDTLLQSVGGVGPDDWERPSNLEGWSVRDVVAHVTGTMAAVPPLVSDPDGALTGPSDPARWRHPEPAAELAARVEAAREAVAGADPDASRQFRGRAMPLGQVLRFPTLDAAVHAWDLQRSLGRPLELPAELVAAGEALAARLDPAGSPVFAPAREPAAGSTPTERLMARLGRETG